LFDKQEREVPSPFLSSSIEREELTEGEVRTGIVRNLVDFGAFVEIGKGIKGLVHASEMPGGQAIRSDLEPGSPVTVRVLEIDEEERQIALRLQDAEAL
jgi:ribosomal protein S1